MRRNLFWLLRFWLAAGAGFCLVAGCASHQPHASRSYDRAIDDEDKDPTYRVDPERADEEVEDAR